MLKPWDKCYSMVFSKLYTEAMFLIIELLKKIFVIKWIRSECEV